ncbi:MAG TPA: hypothetical protein VLW85_17405 [Myxococcales bacterium]|nr:hypothetical protein [Myxococcales bacterium]
MRIRGGAIALLLAACGAPPPPDPWTLWTIDSLALRGDPSVVPANGTLPFFAPPYPAVGSGTHVQASTNPGLTIFPAFSEGQTAAYMTTEIWQNFDVVWVQPLYIDLSGQNKPIFGVGAGTRFYSPFWQIFFYTAPQGASFTGAREVIASGVPLQEGPGKYCALTNDPAILAAVQQNDTVPRRPLTGDEVSAPVNNVGWADGVKVWFIDLGNSQRFLWDYETLVVEETPLFAFALTPGALLDLPRVGGTGPWRSPRCDGQGNCTGIVGGVPVFGALWRVWQVLLPGGADVYVPPSMKPDLLAAVQAMGFPGKVPDSALPSSAKPADYALRVYLNGAWLDSQNAIQANIPDWRVEETGTDVACPLVLFRGAKVPR